MDCYAIAGWLGLDHPDDEGVQYRFLADVVEWYMSERAARALQLGAMSWLDSMQDVASVCDVAIFIGSTQPHWGSNAPYAHANCSGTVVASDLSQQTQLTWTARDSTWLDS